MAFTDIDDPSAFFQCTLYSGDGSTQAITNSGNSDLQPDLVVLKQRNGTEYFNWYDSVRGATKRLTTSVAGDAGSTISGLTAFGTDGFTVGSADTANQNSTNFVSWQWKKSTTAGLDIVSYTGNGSAGKTIAHNLGVIPKVVIVKRLSGTASWMMYHHSLGNNKYLSLDSTAAEDGGHWNSTSPTSSVFSVSADQRVNADGASYIAYVFAEKQGFSKVGGSYVGNGNADGTFVYTGQKSSFVMIKSSALENWYIFDNKRDTFNLVDDAITPNRSNAEISNWGVGFDFCANGFKARATDAAINASGTTYIYMAFAENPFVTSTGVPATAR